MSFVCLECKTWFDIEHGFKIHVGMMHPDKFFEIFGVHSLSVRVKMKRLEVAEWRKKREYAQDDPRLTDELIYELHQRSNLRLLRSIKGNPENATPACGLRMRKLGLATLEYASNSDGSKHKLVFSKKGLKLIEKLKAET